MTPINITSKQALDKFMANDRQIVLFTAPWCKPCVSYKPVLEQLCGDYGIKLAYVNVDDNRDIAGAFAIRSVPTTLITADGAELMRFTGSMTPAALKHALALRGLIAEPV